MKAARRAAAACVLAALAMAGCGGPSAHHPAVSSSARPAPSPHHRAPPGAAPVHTLIVMLENRSYRQVIGRQSAPFLNQLARGGALFTNSRAITHPSQPNYLALFSGSTHGVGDDCPQHFTGANLASELLAAGYTFTGYAEGLPAAGSDACNAGSTYARRHVPWTNFSNVPRSVSLPFSAFPARDFAALPTVSFVIPDLCHDMHDCSVAAGNAWVQAHLAAYAAWAMTHRSLLVVDFDENDYGPGGNHIPTIFYGAPVRPGRYGEPITHYNVLRTIENLYGLRPIGQAATARPITNVWRSQPAKAP